MAKPIRTSESVPQSRTLIRLMGAFAAYCVLMGLDSGVQAAQDMAWYRGYWIAGGGGFIQTGTYHWTTTAPPTGNLTPSFDHEFHSIGGRWGSFPGPYPSIWGPIQTAWWNFGSTWNMNPKPAGLTTTIVTGTGGGADVTTTDGACVAKSGFANYLYNTLTVGTNTFYDANMWTSAYASAQKVTGAWVSCSSTVTDPVDLAKPLDWSDSWWVSCHAGFGGTMDAAVPGLSTETVGLAFDISLDGGTPQDFLGIWVDSVSRQAHVEALPGVVFFMGSTQVGAADLETLLESYFSSSGAWDAPIDGSVGSFDVDFALALASSVSRASIGISLTADAYEVGVPEPSGTVLVVLGLGALLMARQRK